MGLKTPEPGLLCLRPYHQLHDGGRSAPQVASPLFSLTQLDRISASRPHSVRALTAGPIAAAEGFEGQGSRVFTGQIVVLINEGTASAAELASSALQAAGRATLVGTRTFGKGIIHLGAELSDGSMLIVSSGHLVGPSGRNILADAVAPDVFVATPDWPTSRLVAPTLAKLNDDPQIKRAIAWAKGTTPPGVR